jgi:hypothetical protein
VGDPTVLGWCVTILYFLCAFLCYHAAHNLPHTPHFARERLGWSALQAATLLLGVNKQLDLQLHITRVGKRVVYELGLYEFRWLFRLGIFLAALLTMVVVTAWAAALLRQASVQLRWAYFGLLLVFLYIGIRVALFEHVSSRWSGPLSLFLEPAGLVLVGVAARGSVRARLGLGRP